MMKLRWREVKALAYSHYTTKSQLEAHAHVIEWARRKEEFRLKGGGG